MPAIYIRELDNTIYNVIKEVSDDVVFVPGTAITGPYDDAVLCTTYADFIATFGDHAPASSDNTFVTSWDYAVNLLLVNTPVMFRRLTQDYTANPVVDLTGYAVGHSSMQTNALTPATYATISGKYGGTYDNVLYYTTSNDTSNYYLKIYEKTATSTYTLLETNTVCAYTGVLVTDLAAFAAGIADIDSSYVTITGVISGTVTAAAALSELLTDTYTAVAASGTQGGDPTSESEIVASMATIYAEMTDKYLYNVKFITSGGYTSSSSTLYSAMVSLASTRGDAIALLDAPVGTTADAQTNYWYSTVPVNSSYAAAYAPWGYIALKTGETKWAPPSYTFLYTLAKSINAGNKIWQPMAGVNRATVSEINRLEYNIGAATLDNWQNHGGSGTYVYQSTNPIMRLRQYGYVIYGQRTLYYINSTTHSALEELAVRMVSIEIKRKIFETCIRLSFEFNNLHTWNEFKGTMIPYLDSLYQNDALTAYQVIMNDSTTTSSDIEQNKINGIVRIVAGRAGEYFDIGFELSPSGTTFTDISE